MLRRFVIAFGLANLYFVRPWTELLTFSPSDGFLMKSAPQPGVYAGLMATVLALAAVFFFAGQWLSRAKGRAATMARFLFVVSLVIPLDGIRELVRLHAGDFYQRFLRTFQSPVLAVMWVLLAIAVIYFGRRWREHLTGLAAQMLLVSGLFSALNFGQAAHKMAVFRPEAFADGATAPFFAAPAPGRVVYVIFDEWDYRLTFVDPPANTPLPELARVRKEAVFATSAYSPTDDTITSTPSLLTGRLVEEYRHPDQSTLLLRFRGENQFVSYGKSPTLFSLAREGRHNASVVGWYVPYCRLFAGQLVNCYSEEMARDFNSTGSTFTENLVNQGRSVLESPLAEMLGQSRVVRQAMTSVGFGADHFFIPYSLFGQSLVVEKHARTFRRMLGEAKRQVADPRVGVVYLHLGLPHPPGFYDSARRTDKWKNSSAAGYVNALSLLDQTVGELRQSLEAAGLWDETTLILTGDHFFRMAKSFDGKSDHRVPFILKLPRERDSIEISTRFNTLLTRDLILDILAGKVEDARAAAAWVEKTAAAQPETVRSGPVLTLR